MSLIIGIAESTPVWITPSGQIGPEIANGQYMEVYVEAESPTGFLIVDYSTISGELPFGVSLYATGKISGNALSTLPPIWDTAEGQLASVMEGQPFTYQLLVHGQDMPSYDVPLHVDWNVGMADRDGVAVVPTSRVISDTSSCLVIPANDANGATAITESTGKTVVNQGGVVSTTAQKKFGSTSLSFNGAGSLRVNSHAAFTLTADFTLEFFVHHTNLSGSRQVYFEVDSNLTFGIAYMTTGHMQVCYAGSIMSFPYTMVAGTWNHISLTRRDSILTLYVNGVGLGSVLNSSPCGPFAITIGRSTVNTDGFNGYMDDIRFRNGWALRSGNFSPPTAESTASTLTLMPYITGNAYFGQGAYRCLGSQASIAKSISLPADFTVEAFTYAEYTGNRYYLQAATAANTNVISVYDDGSIKLSITDASDTTTIHDTAVASTLRGWDHWAAISRNSVLEFYLNGIERLSIADRKGRAMTLVGSPQIIEESVFNRAVYFKNTYLQYDDSPDFYFDGNLAIEAWVKPVTMRRNVIFYQGEGPGNTNFLIFEITVDGRLRFSMVNASGGSVTLQSNPLIDTTEWRHVAMCRSGTTYFLYINGAQVATTTGTISPIDAPYPAYVGGRVSAYGTELADMKMAGVRVTRGARYQVPFTPPTVMDSSDPSYPSVALLVAAGNPTKPTLPAIERVNFGGWGTNYSFVKLDSTRISDTAVYDYQFTIEDFQSEGIAGYAVLSGTLPPGIRLNGLTGLLSGTPIDVTNGAVLSPAPIPQWLTGTTLPAAQDGVPYTLPFAATARLGTAISTWAVLEGALPHGLYLHGSSGVLTGNPIIPGIGDGISPDPIITAPAPMTVSIGEMVYFDYPITATAGQITNVRLTGLPRGLYGDGKAGFIAGKVDDSDRTYPITIDAQQTNDGTTTATSSIIVEPLPLHWKSTGRITSCYYDIPTSIALWKVNGSVGDVMGGSLTVTGSLEYVTGKFSQAVKFATAKTIGQTFTLSPDVTIEAWVKGGSGVVFSIGSVFTFSLTATTSITVHGTTTTGATWESNRWNHVAIVFTGTETALYVNGQLSATGGAVTFDATWDLTVNALAGGFNGLMEDVRVLNVAHYTAPFTPSHYPFRVNTDIDLRLAASDVPVTYSTLSAIPSGMTFTDGILSGIPTASDKHSFDITASDGTLSSNRTISVRLEIASEHYHIIGDEPINQIPASQIVFDNLVTKYADRSIRLIGQPLAFDLPGRDWSQFTMECWARFDTLGTQQAVLVGGKWMMMKMANNRIRYGYYDGVWVSYGESSTPVGEADWVHLTITYNGTTINGFINGVLVATASGTHAVNWDKLYVGSDATGSFMTGRIEGIRVYDRVKYQSSFTPSGY